MWDNPFINMHASYATELTQINPAHAAAGWLGRPLSGHNTGEVTEDHFKKAAQIPAQ